ncbi:Leucine aminopeptidase 1 [Globomyces sp. JEL0801]|nr:Leucine aminopeptidase 1 [Globomyces sp. JEL0801]
MTGYPTSNPVYAVVTDYTNPALTSVLKTIGKTYTSLPVAETRCGYGCSDHAAYHNAGFPAAFHFETRFDDDNKKIHTAGDVFSVISLQHALEFVKSTIGFAVELSTFKTQ